MAWYDVQLDPQGRPVDYAPASAGNVPAGFDTSLGPPPVMPGASGDVISTTTTAASVRTVAELQARIKAAGGKLVVNANSSDYLVAVNNGLRFGVVKQADGSYVITDSSQFILYLGIAIAVGAVILLSRR